MPFLLSWSESSRHDDRRHPTFVSSIPLHKSQPINRTYASLRRGIPYRPRRFIALNRNSSCTRAILRDHTLRTSATTPATTSVPASQPETSFAEEYATRLPQWLISRLHQMDFTHPTEVQRATLHKALPQPPSTLGEDVVIHAQTGSGKSLAYLLPAITAVDPGRASTQALIVVPTQELGMQVYKLLRRLISAYGHDRSDDLEHSIDAIIDADFDDGTTEQDTTDEPLVALEQPSLPTVSQSFPVLPMLNQANLRRQKLQLRQAAPRIIVGNPHRIAQLVDSGRLRLDLLKVLVVDEFDACLLDTSTTSALQTILSVRGKEGPRQTILASATVPQHRHFLRQCVRQMWTRPDIRHVWVEQTSGERVPSSLTHLYAVCEARKKLRALNMLIVRFNNQLSDKTHTDFGVKAIVFVMASRSIQEIVDALNTSLTARYSKQDAQLVVGIDNDLPIVLRRDALNRFRKGEARVLVATDLAARGLDIPDISHVFHFDLPTEPDAYLHRAGRAARQGRSGTSVVLVSAGEGFVISRTSNALGIEFDRIGR